MSTKQEDDAVQSDEWEARFAQVRDAEPPKQESEGQARQRDDAQPMEEPGYGHGV